MAFLSLPIHRHPPSKLSKISCFNYDYDSNQYLKHLTIFKIFAKLHIKLSVNSFDVSSEKNPESGCFATRRHPGGCFTGSLETPPGASLCVSPVVWPGGPVHEQEPGDSSWAVLL